MYIHSVRRRITKFGTLTQQRKVPVSRDRPAASRNGDHCVASCFVFVWNVCSNECCSSICLKWPHYKLLQSSGIGSDRCRPDRLDRTVSPSRIRSSVVVTACLEAPFDLPDDRLAGLMVTGQVGTLPFDPWGRTAGLKVVVVR